MTSRSKGAKAERDVADIIKTWWRQLEPEAAFVRTPGSGGFGAHWLSDEDRAGFKTTGDIMTTADKWPFDVEVKRREGWADVPFFKGAPSPVWEWWIQTQRSAMISRREPMLWLRRSRTPWLVILRTTYVDKLFVGYERESLPTCICTHCRKSICGERLAANPVTCNCVSPRPGSGTLGAPHHVWGESLLGVNYGANWPICFLAEKLVSIHPLRFVIGSPMAPRSSPEMCPKCGEGVSCMRGDTSTKVCSAKCGWRFNRNDTITF